VAIVDKYYSKQNAALTRAEGIGVERGELNRRAASGFNRF